MPETTPELLPSEERVSSGALTRPPTGFQIFKQIDVWKGIALLCLCHALLFAVAMLQRDLNWNVFAILMISITQLIYAVPLYLFLRWRGKKIIAQGLLIGVSLTFLVNATCAGIFFSFRLL